MSGNCEPLALLCEPIALLCEPLALFCEPLALLCEPLALLFGKSLSTGSDPLDWKSSAITPIFKAGDPALASNYRPISLFSLVSKLLEHFIHNALLEHVLEYGYLSPKQFGFRPGSSTQEAILAATHDWHEALERHNVFYLSKAFDSLPHSVVLASLAKVGVCGTLYSWFQSYLSGCQQRVVRNGVSSQPARVTSGVPRDPFWGLSCFCSPLTLSSKYPSPMPSSTCMLMTSYTMR